MDRLTALRNAFLVLFVISVLVVANNAVSAGSIAKYPYKNAAQSGEQVIPPQNGMVAVTTAEPGRIIVFAEDGTIEHYDNEYDQYNDVDPVPESPWTVEYVATHHFWQDCPDTATACSRVDLQRLNVKTGEKKTLYSRWTAGHRQSGWHDADRIDDDRYVVADIAWDRLFIINTATEIIEWEWDVQRDFDLRGGGPFPVDWTHVNDVEVINESVFMTSLRNQDQAVFVHKDHGVIDGWTLGEEDNYDILYEQHNPDFIASTTGRPAVLVADSQNDRIVEYQRTDGGGWERTWTWADQQAAWARDADRLPDCNTLITDTNSNRVMEVNRNGDIEWTFTIDNAYDAERLDTGDESADNRRATDCGLVSVNEKEQNRTTDQSMTGSIRTAMVGLLPAKIANGLRYIIPYWMNLSGAIGASVGAVSLLCLLVIEIRRRLRISVQLPLTRISK